MSYDVTFTTNQTITEEKVHEIMMAVYAGEEENVKWSYTFVDDHRFLVDAYDFPDTANTLAIMGIAFTHDGPQII